MLKINPNSSIRSGYKYEDLHVLQLCVEWLSDPDKFMSIKIQYTPTGITGFAMDDIVVELPNRKLLFYQLKHKQNPETDLWDLRHLIDKGLYKWIVSYEKLGKNMISECSLITNGNPGGDVKACMNGGKLTLELIGTYYPEILNEINSNIKSDTLVREFFKNFNFNFSGEDKYTLERKLRNYLYDELKVTKAGVDSLLLFIGDQGSEKYPKYLTLEEIRKYLSWDNPRPLNQNFKIPVDFEFFSQLTHERIVENLANPSGGIMVFTGKPGAGKSTYLSKLYSVLQIKKILVFRHHYHLNPKDNSQYERLNSDRVKEALKAEFKTQKSSILQELGINNTEHTPLREFISKIAAYYAKKGRAFVLIIDGLDHVIREGHSEDQLTDFLKDILYPQPGYWLLLGTQEMAVKCFPNAIFRLNPEDSWIKIKGLSREATEKIVNKTFKPLNKKHDRDIRIKTVDKIYQITAGNPLHLRYVLGEIRNSGEHISQYELDKIPAYNGDIKNYYADMWRQLTSLAKTFCFALTIIDFKLHKDQLTELGSYLTKYPSEITESYREIRHLLSTELSGISVYHNSFLVFMLDQPELEEQKLLIYKSIRNWLTSSTNENLKWSELAKVEYFLGNVAPILSIDKEWVINSYLACKDENQIQNLLELAKEASFKTGDYRKNIYFSELSSRFGNREDNLWPENLQKIWLTAFRSKPALEIPYPDFSNSTHYQLKELLITLKKKGRIKEIPDAAKDRINELVRSKNQEQTGMIKSWLEVLMNFENISDKRILSFLNQFRKGKQSAPYYGHYIAKLLGDQKKFQQRIDALLTSKLHEDEKKAIARVFMHNDLKNGTFDWQQHISSIAPEETNTSKIYYYLLSARLPGDLQLYKRQEFPEKHSYASGETNTRALFLHQFYTALFISLSEDPKLTTELKKWQSISDSSIQTAIINAVLAMAISLADCLKNKKACLVDQILAPLGKLEELDFYKNHDLYEIRRSAIPGIISQIIWLSQVFNRFNGLPYKLNEETLKILIESKWYYKSSLIELLHDKQAVLSEIAFLSFTRFELKNLENELIPFKDKTELMANLAILASEHNQHDSLKILLFKSAENIISYGNHKDMLLYDILLGIQKCGDAGSDQLKNYLRTISPFIYHIKKLTDGDETGGFIYDFSEQLATHDPEILYKFYFQACKKREYYLSENLFGDVLHTLDFTKQMDSAIGNTAVGDGPYSELEKLSANNPSAASIINNIQASLGKIDFSRRPDENKNSHGGEERGNIEEYQSVTTDLLEQHLENLKEKTTFYRHDKSTYLRGWARFWLEKPGADIYATISKLKSTMEKDLAECDHELLEYLYPYLKSIDPEFGFVCLCWAASNSGAWSSDYFHKPEDSRQIWKLAINDFPDRLDEFFQTSIMNSGLRYGKRKPFYGTPCPKAIQFLIDCGNLNRAEQLISYYLEILPVMFPNVNLPEPEFYHSDQVISKTDILLNRMEWLSPIVRERTAQQIIQLLANDSTGEFHQSYFDWMGKIKLESRACDALMILLGSAQYVDSKTRKYLNSKNLGGLLRICCIATELLMDVIARTINIVCEISLPGYVSMSFSKNKQNNETEFIENVGHHLPIIYRNHIRNLQESVPFSLWQAWNQKYDDRCEELGLEYTRDDRNYCNDFNRHMTGRSTIFTDILRSTFFNVLDYLYDQGFISFDDFYAFTIRNFAQDLSFIKIPLKPKPEWWPFLVLQEKKNQEGFPEINLNLKELLNPSAIMQVLSLEGTITNSENFYHNNLFCSIRITPFGVTGNFDRTISAEKIFQALEQHAGFWYQSLRGGDFDLFSSELSYRQTPEIDFKTFKITPLVSDIYFPGTNMWQYYRLFHHMRLVNPIIKGELKLQTNVDGLAYYQNDKMISSFHDFLGGLRDCSDISSQIPYGNYILIEKDHLAEKLSQNKTQLFYAIRKTYFTKSMHSKRDEFIETQEYQIFNPAD